MAFCRLPWQGIQITPLGDFRMCALINNNELHKGVSLDQNGQPMNVLTHSFNQALNGPIQRAVRLHDIRTGGEWHPACSCCRERESATGGANDHDSASRRQSMEHRNSSTHIVSPTTYKNVPIAEDGSVAWNPTTLDIRFGNLCNQACVQCGPHNSNQWYEESVGFRNSLEVPWSFGRRTMTLERDQHNRLRIPGEVRWWESPVWWEKFEQLLPTLEHIYITGGEPMIVPAHDEMLDRIIAGGYAKNIYLDYDSNLSVINDKLAERWNHFKHVEIAGSMDATGTAFELIRTGNWSVFERNVKRVREYEHDGVVKLHRLTACAQLSTMHTMFDTEDWVQSQGVPFQVKFIDYPLSHSLSVLPTGAKQELIELYSTRDTPAATTIRTWLSDHIDEKYTNIRAMHEYMRFMDYLDTTRNTQWRTVLPGTVALLDKYIV
jgi:hypothetical protein